MKLYLTSRIMPAIMRGHEVRDDLAAVIDLHQHRLDLAEHIGIHAGPVERGGPVDQGVNSEDTDQVSKTNASEFETV
jgi:hypothetical protein